MREKSSSARALLVFVSADVDIQGTYLGGYRSTECSLWFPRTLLQYRLYGVSLTCQVLEINVFNDCAEIYIRRREGNRVNGNWLRAESHG